MSAMSVTPSRVFMATLRSMTMLGAAAEASCPQAEMPGNKLAVSKNRHTDFFSKTFPQGQEPNPFYRLRAFSLFQ
jgi:hypothetical protein